MTAEELLALTTAERMALPITDLGRNTCETNCTNCDLCAGCTGCHDCTRCTRCTNCSHSVGCTDCLQCHYCTDCSGCQYCVGIRNGTDQTLIAWGIKLTPAQFLALVTADGLDS